MAKSNEVTLSGAQIQNVTYVDHSLVITTGEDSSPPPSIKQNEEKAWIIDLSADRKGSSDVANSFNAACGGASHEYAPKGGGTGHSPSSLNFYFAVNVTFATPSGNVTVKVYLAQGNYSTTNNWWIGANSVVNIGTPSLCAITNNQIAQIYQLGGGTSDFTFTAAS